MINNFNYIEFAIEMSTQAKDLAPTDVKQEQDYISNTVYLAATYAGEKVCNNIEYSTKEKEFISQLICEWSFHKVIDLLRARIKKNYHKEIMLNIIKTAFETAEVCIANGIKEKIILKEVETKIADSYIKSIEKLYNENLIEEEQLKKAYNQSNIDKMANEYKQEKKENKIKQTNTDQQKGEKNASSKAPTKAKKSLWKYYTPYYIGGAIILTLAIYGTVYAYLKLNSIELPLNSTVFSIVTKPSFFIPAIIAVILHDVLQYIFIGLGKYENEYLEEIEEIDPTSKGLKNFISPKTIKQRVKTLLFISMTICIAIFFLIANLLKHWVLIVPITIVYYYTSYKNSIPAMNLQDIILHKDFIIGVLAAIITYNLINKKKSDKNNKLQTEKEETENYFPDETDVSFQELAELVDEMGEDKTFDYKQFANHIAENLSRIAPNNIEENTKNKIIKRVIDYALLSGDALDNDDECYTTTEKIFILKSVAKWTFYKSIDITRAGLEEKFHDEILQNIAFYAYEIAKQGSIKSVQKEKIAQAIELGINKEFANEIKELHEQKQIPYETYLKAQNESFIEEIAEKLPTR